MSDAAPTIHSATEGGIAATHLPLPELPTLVAPSATGKEKEHNTIKSSLIPFACWRANDILFAFESSFVRPGTARETPGSVQEIDALQDLIDLYMKTDAQGKQHKPALSVFGHADPTGADDFNKALSGRRAQAIYALLTRKVELWEDLYSNPLGNDKWEPKAIHEMQTTLGQTESDHPSAGARKALFKAYMDKVCAVPDEKGQASSFELKPTNFLTEGADAKGKGDYQGCGEFNPTFLQAKADVEKFIKLPDFSPEKPILKAVRDAANEPNRRVVIFLFRPGVRISPNNWPCPRAKEGMDGGKKRFWSDGEHRRAFGDNQRRFEETFDTVACRFYQRLTTNSPPN